jgi:hypothetical protein
MNDNLSYNLIEEDIIELQRIWYIHPLNWIYDIYQAGFSLKKESILLDLLKMYKNKFKGKILKDLVNVINNDRIFNRIIINNCKHKEELIDLLIYFGADISKIKEKYNKIYESGVIDQKMRVLVEYKIEKNLFVDTIDKFIIGQPCNKYIIDDEDIAYNPGDWRIDLEPRTIEYQKDKLFDSPEIIKWNEYFNKVEAGRKIVRYIKNALNDEFEMKPLRTKIDLKKFKELINVSIETPDL